VGWGDTCKFFKKNIISEAAITIHHDDDGVGIVDVVVGRELINLLLVVSDLVT